MAQTPEAPPPPEPIPFAEPKQVNEWPHSREFEVVFPTALPSGIAENDTVPVILLLPKEGSGPFPTVVILHYWGALNRSVERAMAEELNSRGIAALLMTLPYHLERTPQGVRSGELAIQGDPEKLKATILQSLQDTRRAIDFVQSRPELDHTRIGLTGLSLGAIVTALVYGIDERVSQSVFVLGGVDIAHILWHSSRVVPQREELRRRGYTEEKLSAELAPLEPRGFIERRAQSDALVIAARYDTVIPPKSTQELISALKNPQVSWLETGHFGGAFVQKRLLRETAKFFESRFSGESYRPRENLGAPTIRLGVQYTIGTGMDIGFGADLWSAGKNREYAATALLTPRGARLFFGRRAGRQLSVGGLFDGRRVNVGVLWSTVL